MQRCGTKKKASRIFAGCCITIVSLVAVTIAAQKTLYTEDFSGTKTLADRGFTSIAHWFVDSSFVMRSSSFGGWDGMSKAISPSFDADRSENAVSISWSVRFPTDNGGKSWREQNKVYVGLLNADGELLYKFLFKPNRKQDLQTSYDMQLKRYNGEEKKTLAEVSSHKLTPDTKSAQFVSFLMVLKPDGTISVSYDAADGKGLIEYINVKDTQYNSFDKLRYEYKTGSETDNYYIEVDDIKVVLGTSDSGSDDSVDSDPAKDINTVIRDVSEGTSKAKKTEFKSGEYKNVRIFGKMFHYVVKE